MSSEKLEIRNVFKTATCYLLPAICSFLIPTCITPKPALRAGLGESSENRDLLQREVKVVDDFLLGLAFGEVHEWHDGI
jgi:hypothetical protein